MIILREKAYINVEPIKRPISKLKNIIDVNNIRFKELIGENITGPLRKKAAALERLRNMKASKNPEYYIRYKYQPNNNYIYMKNNTIFY